MIKTASKRKTSVGSKKTTKAVPKKTKLVRFKKAGGAKKTTAAKKVTKRPRRLGKADKRANYDALKLFVETYSRF